jgi:hypothetical protein
MSNEHGITVARSALFDSERRHRYSLTREFSGGPSSDRTVYVIGCNPSVADDMVDDPTIRKVVSMLRFAVAGGTLVMLNLHPRVQTNLHLPLAGEGSLRSDAAAHCETEVDALRHNEIEIKSALEAKLMLPDRDITVIAAWGALGEKFFGHLAELTKEHAHRRGVQMMCWGETKTGAPRHPLYLKSNTPLVEFHGRREKEK